MRHTSEEPLQSVSYAVTLVGAGALGAEICLAFTRCLPGLIRTVTLIDPDVVQSHNIARSKAWADIASALHGKVIGNSKAKCAVRYCQANAPHTRWESKSCEFADVGWGELLDTDVLITCTDSAISRMEAAYAARMLRLPMLDAGVMGPAYMGGRVAVYAPHAQAACYSCGLSTGTRAAMLEHLASPTLSCAALPPATAMGTSEAGAVSAAMTAERVMQQLLDGLRTTESFAWRVLEDRTDRVALTPSGDCPWHHEAECIALEDDHPIGESLADECVLLLPWPMALDAVCNSCGARHQIPTRLSQLRRDAACTHCGEDALQPVQVVERIVKNDAVAQRTPRELGLPRRSVLPVRRRIQTQRTD